MNAFGCLVGFPLLSFCSSDSGDTTPARQSQRSRGTPCIFIDRFYQMSHLLLMLRFIRFNYNKIINTPWNSLTKTSLNCFQCNKLDSLENVQRLLNRSTEQGNTTNPNLFKVRVTELLGYGSMTEIKREKRMKLPMNEMRKITVPCEVL